MNDSQKMKKSNLDTPKDLRGTKKEGRPSVTERSSKQRREELAKDVIYLALVEMKKQIKGSSVAELTNIIRTLTPIVQDRDKEMDEEVSINVLIRNYHDVSCRIQTATETPETIEEETD